MENERWNFAEDPEAPFPLIFVEPEPEPALTSEPLDVMERVAQISGRSHPNGSGDKILVLHSIGGRDVQAEELVAELAAHGASAYFFHTHAFLRACRLSIELDQPGSTAGLLHLPAGDLALDEVKSVWFRGPGIELGDLAGQPEQKAQFVRRETEAALFGLLGVLDQAFWVNHPVAVYAAEDKLAQLKLAQSLGFLIPRTLLTNDPHRARDFYASCNGEVILKTFRRLAYSEGGRERLILTNRVLPGHLDQIERVRHTPCFFQEYVPKEFELRVTIVGRRVFAAEIHSQSSSLSRDDYRRYDFANTPYYPHTLPPAVEAACLKILQRYGLSYGAIDMIRRPDGAYVFLEINANAQFLWIQDLTGMPIRQALAEMLIRGSVGD
jgi:glutathione synthase/RimK-type ligase-like ATP-grasp enzyme